MEETQTMGIKLDEKSIEILKKVDAVFRDSLLNIGLRMVEKTELFNTIVGTTETEVPVEEMASLDSLEEDNEDTNPKIYKKSKTSKQEPKEEPKKAPTTSWDAF